MSNVNSFADFILSSNNGQPLTLAIPTTGHLQFKQGAGVAVLNIPNPLATIDSALGFPGRAAQAIPITVRAAGTIQLGRGVQSQIDINQGTGLSPAIASTGLQISPLGAGLYLDNWLIEIEGMWDAASLNFRGNVSGWFGATSISSSTLVGSQPATLAALQFNVAVTVLNTNASNQFTLNEFSAELT